MAVALRSLNMWEVSDDEVVASIGSLTNERVRKLVDEGNELKGWIQLEVSSVLSGHSTFTPSLRAVPASVLKNQHAVARIEEIEEQIKRATDVREAQRLLVEAKKIRSEMSSDIDQPVAHPLQDRLSTLLARLRAIADELATDASQALIAQKFARFADEWQDKVFWGRILG